VPEVSVAGHTLRLVERASGTVVSPFTDEALRWAKAYPYPLPQQHVVCRGLVFAIPPGERNYYHLLVNHLLPFAHAALRHRAEIQGHKIHLVTRDAPSVMLRFADALKFCGFDVSVLHVTPSQRIEAEFGLSAWTHHPTTHPSHGYWAGPEGEELTAAFDRVVPAMSTPTKIHIPRTETDVRMISNNGEVLGLLASTGHEPMMATWDNFDAQYRMFRQAREVVAVHGAGLTNICWTQPGTRVTEITPTNARRSHFLQIASERQSDFRFFFAGAEVKKQNFGVDVSALGSHLAAS
jgi:capsular polysaccharide biosynthesis protein